VIRRSHGLSTLLALAVVLSGAAGCSPAPPPEPPTMAAPDTWRSPSASPGTTAVADNWWQAFEDPQLDALVTRGLAANHDLALAISRVEESRDL